MRRLPRALRDDRGLTLVEMLVALSLAAVAATVVYTVFISTQGAFVDTRSMTEQQQDARVVLGIMTQDIRAAGSNARDIGLERLAVCENDTLRVQSDLNENGVLDAVVEPAEDVTWYFDPGSETLVRRTASGDMPLLRDVTRLDFSYLDAGGNVIAGFPIPQADRSRVRAVNVTLAVRINRTDEREWTSTVALRNDAQTF